MFKTRAQNDLNLNLKLFIRKYIINNVYAGQFKKKTNTQKQLWKEFKNDQP